MDARCRPACRSPNPVRRAASWSMASLSGQQAAAVEPLIAGFWQQGREQTRHAHALFWTRMADDGLLDPGLDLEWLIDTTTILDAAETYLLITRLMRWDLDTYQDWLATTAARLARVAEGIA
ncbi:MAG TPA: hypothetical protein VMA97_13865 [Streptosporangiaceae bacterium]|nr:hypothetical protein [Streptosporangiaceae bacterium]